MAKQRDTNIQLFGFLLALGAMGVIGLIGRTLMTEDDKKQLSLTDKPSSTIVPVEDLPTHHSLAQGSYQATLMRQSGNVYRELENWHSLRMSIGIKSPFAKEVSAIVLL